MLGCLCIGGADKSKGEMGLPFLYKNKKENMDFGKKESCSDAFLRYDQ